MAVEKPLEHAYHLCIQHTFKSTCVNGTGMCASGGSRKAALWRHDVSCLCPGGNGAVATAAPARPKLKATDERGQPGHSAGRFESGGAVGGG